MLKAAEEWRSRNKYLQFYPDQGPLRRELYPKHLQFFKAGNQFDERLAICGNRIGKTEGLLCYETTLHVTGRYPDWWEGRRFTRPINAWLAGKTGETTRDILQFKLLGRMQRDPEKGGRQAMGLGTGMIPADAIITTSPKTGLPDAIDTVWIRHELGGASQITFKSYGKDRDSFEGTERDLIGLDEEPPADVDDECSMRLMATRPGERGGLKIITFTPLEGYTEVVKRFLESTNPDKFFIQIGWDDNPPHLSPEEQEKQKRKYLPSQLAARTRGEPDIGEGAIYPISIDELLVDDFQLPDHWPRCFGMDVGKTAVVWGALNRDTDVLYLYKEYYSEVYNTVMHAAAIRGQDGRDEWIPGVIDPSGLQSNQVDGRKLLNIYKSLGLDLAVAENPVEAGLDAVWIRMSTGRLKVFRSLKRWQNEFGRYHRKKKETEFGVTSKVVKKDDHEMDATRYMVVSGIQRAKVKPPSKRPGSSPGGGINRPGASWMGS